MAENKKFYWLKLDKDFFKNHQIKVVESMPNGKDYILFYLKMLCESISHEGTLRFSDTIPYNDEMLASITNTNIDVVRSAIKIFSSLGMIEIWDDGTFFMAECQKMIGSETNWAVKKREYREKQTKLGQCPQDVLVMSDKSIEYRDKSIDKELNNNTIQQKTTSKLPQTNVIEELFNRFWSAYPKKKEKQKALDWFKKNKPSKELVDKMIDTIYKFKNTIQWTKDKGQFIPYPITWLRGGCWDDEVEVNNSHYVSKNKSTNLDNVKDEDLIFINGF